MVSPVGILYKEIEKWKEITDDDNILDVIKHGYHSGAGSVQFSHELCTSGYKYDTFSICSSNLPDYKIDASQRDFFHFQDGYHDFQDGRQIDNISTNKS